MTTVKIKPLHVMITKQGEREFKIKTKGLYKGMSPYSGGLWPFLEYFKEETIFVLLHSQMHVSENHLEKN